MAFALRALEGSWSMSTWFHCMGTKARLVEFGVGLGDQL